MFCQTIINYLPDLFQNVYKLKNIAMPISDFGGEPLKAFYAGEYFNKFEFYDENKLIGCIMTENSVEPE